MKKISLPTILTFVFICVIVYLFISLKQTKVICEKTTTFDSIKLNEVIVVSIDGKSIRSMNIEKEIVLPDKLKSDSNFEYLREELDYTLKYLGNSVNYSIDGNSFVVGIDVSNNELVLIDNITLHDKNGLLKIDIDPNTKSSNVITLKVGDNYTDGEFMMRLKSEGYSCK